MCGISARYPRTSTPAFGVGEDDRHLTSVDVDGVSLAGIQALEKRTRELQNENRELREKVRELEEIKNRLEQLEAAISNR